MNHSEISPLISVIIPTLNGEKPLLELLASLTIQTLKPDEIIVVDSSSTDGTRAVAEQYDAEVIKVARDSFDHGGTRSMAADSAKGQILIFLTQDVLLANRSTLKKLVEPILQRKEIACSFGRQLPAFDASDTASHLRFFNYPEESYVRKFSDRRKYGLKTIFTSNSCAAYQKKFLKDIGFFKDGLIFGEDTCAVGRLLEKGFNVAYVSEAIVYHSHNYTFEEEFQRYFDIGVFHSSEKWLLDTFGKAEGRGLEYLRSGLLHHYKNRKYSLIADFMVRTGLKFIGYRLGRNFRVLPKKILPTLSLHKKWWERESQF